MRMHTEVAMTKRLAIYNAYSAILKIWCGNPLIRIMFFLAAIGSDVALSNGLRLTQSRK